MVYDVISDPSAARDAGVEQARVFGVVSVTVFGLIQLLCWRPYLEDSLHSMAAHNLPNEIWLYIFELATAEYLPNEELPNSMDRSAWFKNVFDAWCLQSPDELVRNAQKKRYKTVKVRCTCLADACVTSSDVEFPGYPLDLQTLAPSRWRIPVQSHCGIQAISHAPSVQRFG